MGTQRARDSNVLHKGVQQTLAQAAAERQNLSRRLHDNETCASPQIEMDRTKVDQLMSMGHSATLAKEALRATGNEPFTCRTSIHEIQSLDRVTLRPTGEDVGRAVIWLIRASTTPKGQPESATLLMEVQAELDRWRVLYQAASKVRPSTQIDAILLSHF